VQWSSLNYWHAVFSKKSNKEIVEIVLLSLLQYSCSQDDGAGASLVEGCVFLKNVVVDIIGKLIMAVHSFLKRSVSRNVLFYS